LNKPIKIFISALEYSANIHLSYLIQTLQKQYGECHFYGIFDSKILGFSSNFSPNEFRIMGFSGVLKLIPRFFKIKKELIVLAKQCDIAIFMDSSSFNIPLLKALSRDLNKPYLVYYILPQVWAWKAYRAKILAQICDELWGILPFESAYYPKEANIAYVGHPLLDEIPFSREGRVDTGIIAFMPGSRISEIKALFPIFKSLAKKLKALQKQPLLIAPKHFENCDLSKIYGNLEDFSIVYDTYEGLAKCEFAFVCSGTATLESTLLGIPTILAYKARKLDYWIAKSLVKLNYIGLANIFLEFFYFGSPHDNKTPQNFPIHPEFLQEEVNPNTLFWAMQNYDYSKFFAQKKILLEYLKNGSAKNCVQKIENFAKNMSKN